MKKEDIKRHLKDYSIYQKRKTTINHAFASALSVSDEYVASKIDEGLRILGQDPQADLMCAYCDKPAETWDHIIAIVENGKFSGYGHRINILIPCKSCNSMKGNKSWDSFIANSRTDSSNRIDRITNYIGQDDIQINDFMELHCKKELEEFDSIKQNILSLLQKADDKAAEIRQKIRSLQN